MSREQANTQSRIYYQVYDGTFRTRVKEGEDGALERTNKLGKQVFEREVKALFGLIEDVAFEESEYGRQLKITLDANENGQHPVLSFGVESKDGRDILKKLPNINFKREVRIMPYRFTGEDNREYSGVAIHQQGEADEFSHKITNFFFDDKKKEFVNGYPTIDWDNASESEQKIYKIKRDEFLQEYTRDHIIPKVHAVEKSVSPINKSYEEQELNEEFDPKKIPF